MKWISVKEKIPKAYKEVLIWIEDARGPCFVVAIIMLLLHIIQKDGGLNWAADLRRYLIPF